MFRSQMAGIMFKSMVPSADVATAGVLAARAGQRLATVSPTVVTLMQERGFDVSSNMITRLTPEMVEAADRVILMGAIPGGPVPEYLRSSSKLEVWNVPDPGYGQISLGDARDVIFDKVKKLAVELGDA